MCRSPSANSLFYLPPNNYLVVLILTLIKAIQHCKTIFNLRGARFEAAIVVRLAGNQDFLSVLYRDGENHLLTCGDQIVILTSLRSAGLLFYVYCLCMFLPLLEALLLILGPDSNFCSQPHGHRRNSGTYGFSFLSYLTYLIMLKRGLATTLAL